MTERSEGMTGTALGTWDAVRLVAGREITTRAGSKAFRITTILMVVVVVGFVVLMKVLSGGDDAGSRIGFAPAVAPLAAAFTSVAGAVGENVTTSQVDEATGEQQVRDGKLVPLESTLLTSRGNFGDAVAEGTKKLGTRRDFQSMMDIVKARGQNVTPIPLRTR